MSSSLCTYFIFLNACSYVSKDDPLVKDVYFSVLRNRTIIQNV